MGVRGKGREGVCFKERERERERFDLIPDYPVRDARTCRAAPQPKLIILMRVIETV